MYSIANHIGVASVTSDFRTQLTRMPKGARCDVPHAPNATSANVTNAPYASLDELARRRLDEAVTQRPRRRRGRT